MISHGLRGLSGQGMDGRRPKVAPAFVKLISSTTSGAVTIGPYAYDVIVSVFITGAGGASDTGTVGGGGGQAVSKHFLLPAGTTFTYTIGAGASSADGGDTTVKLPFGALVTAQGGKSGATGGAGGGADGLLRGGDAARAGGAGGNGSGASGAAGSNGGNGGTAIAGQAGGGGAGGFTDFGPIPAGNGANGNATGNAPGGGGGANSSTSQAGANGGAFIVLVKRTF